MTEQTGPTDADKLAGLRAELAGLQTEAATDSLKDLDILGTDELVAAMLAHSSGVHAAVSEAGPAIVQTVDAVAERLQRGGAPFVRGRRDRGAPRSAGRERVPADVRHPAGTRRRAYRRRP
ncbi:hypothetical protein AAHB34_05520 [Paenarthrobacter ureafaciens]